MGEIMEDSGIKMRIIALDEMMKTCVEAGRKLDAPEQKVIVKAMYESAKERRDFLMASRKHELENEG